jgi:hypothetical protein
MPANTSSADSANPSAANTDLQGLELAEHHFGPLLHPTRATQSAWTNYSINRLQTSQKYGVINSRKGSGDGSEDGSGEDSGEDEYDDEDWLLGGIIVNVSRIEKEMNLEHGILQKCITILSNDTVLDEDEVRMAC